MSSLVNIPIARIASVNAAAGPPDPTAPLPTPPADSVGVFVTPQSLMTFPVSSTMVTIVWKVLANVFPSWGGSKVVPLVAALAVGLLIYFLSEKPALTRKDQIVGLGIAVLNSFTLAATALGISDAITPPGARPGA